ncbi:hypothetical protein [Parvularcula sp. IMCC14364]|uniref:hypothetical protein n=1 Tax=Parvularcula sp. IMCC14364 TaxID=3067902 RepID=UPI002741D847|nr:hypothetical protein [Parvularcula sp. IMCC14364]
MTLFFTRLALAATLFISFAGLPAHAQSLTGNVGSAGVTDGEQAFEARLGINDDGDAASRIHYDYSFNDWYQLRIIVSFSQPDGEDWDYTGITFENWLQWREEADDNSSFNGGLRFAYGFADDGGPDEAEVRLTITDKFAGVWEWRANIIGEVETGDGSEGGVSLEARGQLSRALDVVALGSEKWRLGVELFSEFGNSRDIPDFDDQAHQIGPVAKVSWKNGVYLQTAVRVDLTDGADDTMAKLFLGREF